MKITESYKRLNSLWGVIDHQHNEQIASHISPFSHVLDIGCGYGSLVNYLSEQGYEAEGIDIEKDVIDIAKQLFPHVNVKTMNAEDIDSISGSSFDVVVLRDALHHLIWEHESERVFQNIRRILKPGGKLVIWDPNPMWILRFARKVIHHIDPQASVEMAKSVLAREKFYIESLSYYEAIGLPLSGGYVGLQLIPNVKVFNTLIAKTNGVLSRLINLAGLGRIFCWRYLFVAHL